MRIRLITLITLLVTITGLAFGEDRVVDRERGFSIMPAEGWSRAEPPSSMPYCVLKLLKTENDGAGTKLYVDIFAPDKPGLTLGEYVQGVKNFINQDMGGQVLSEARVTVSGLPAYKLLYAGKAVGFTDKNNKFLRVVTQGRNGKFYVLHCVANPDNFDKRLPEIEGMASSLELP